jgi:hypothetical protein
MYYRVILAAVLLWVSGCCYGLRTPHGTRALLLERRAFELPVKHVINEVRTDDEWYVSAGTGFVVSWDLGITTQHDLPPEVKSVSIDGQEARIVERSNVQENLWDDWMTFSMPKHKNVPRIDPDVDLPPGTRFVIVGFPDCGMKAETPERVAEKYLACPKRVLHCAVVRRPFYLKEVPRTVFARIADPEPSEGFSGGLAAVLDHETGVLTVFGIYTGLTMEADPFTGTPLAGLFVFRAGVIRRIPEHLLVEEE